MSNGKIKPSESGPGSVTGWLDQLRHVGPDERLQREIWDRYFRKLAAVARSHLSPHSRRTVDEEDVALSVLNSFFARLGSGRFTRLSDRAQLWALLTKIATYKAISVRTKQNAQKRGGGNVRGHSAFFNGSSLHELVTTDPGPQELAEFKELVANLLQRLDPTLSKIGRVALAAEPPCVPLAPPVLFDRRFTLDWPAVSSSTESLRHCCVFLNPRVNTGSASGTQ